MAKYRKENNIEIKRKYSLKVDYIKQLIKKIIKEKYDINFDI